MRRSSGILLHLTSLPSPFGIGDLGPEAYRFADFLSECDQSYWQILPMTPTSTRYGNSPYSSDSAFACNALLISPERMSRDGLIDPRSLRVPMSLKGSSVNYPAVTKYKGELLDQAYRRVSGQGQRRYDFEFFCDQNAYWLEDYSLFKALKGHFKNTPWNRWPPRLRDRDRGALREFREKLHEVVTKEKLIQYIFFKQWTELKTYCQDKKIMIIGDIPIYVHFDSADVWAHPEIFRLDLQKNPLVVAGIPPDFFSATGQLWGNPIFDWERLKRRGYDWWVARIRHTLRYCDLIRLDHFKGFVDYWEVPAGHKTAARGRWVTGPGENFFNSLLRRFPFLPFIAEDLGVITAEVHRLRDQFGLPGMRVLQFAFGNDPLADFYLPHQYIRNCVAYPGTHDNDTLMGWFFGKEDYSTRKPGEITAERKNALRYLQWKGAKTREIRWEFIRAILNSAAELAVIPLQDVLGLGSEGRMNRPATAEGNWAWRFSARQITPGHRRRLRELTRLSARA